LKFLHNFSKTAILEKSLSFRGNKWQETAEVRHFNRLSHRLDNVIFKTGFSFSLNQACQYISHGKVLVNGKRIHSRYHHLKSSDIVTFDPSLFSQIRFNFLANLSQKAHCTLFLETNYAIFCIVVLKDLLGPQEHLLLSNPLIDYPKL
jgi:ribosomal protein S4